jgi:tetratricopeptide (TPR) repeat protein
MGMEYFIKACAIAGFLLLAGCQGTPQTDQLANVTPAGLAPAYQIKNVPFVAQQQYYCGPTTLAEVFKFYGTQVSADDIAPKIFIPEKEGSLQLEMVTAARQYHYLPYQTQGTLTLLMQLISDDIPVIVFQNLSISLLPQWHYAVVTGFDLTKQTITLHTGVTQDHEMSFSLFEKTWGRGNYWLLAPVPPQVTSEHMVPFKYISAAYDMLKVAENNSKQQEQALLFLQSATKQWPNEWLAYFLLGNFYLESQPDKANVWFKKGYQYGKGQQPYLHNYTLALLKTGQRQAAASVLAHAINTFPNDSDFLALKQRLD